MLSEHEGVLLIQCAADRDEEAAKRFGPEFYQEYLELVAEMEEYKKKGIKCTYDVPYNYD